ncbi:MAG TPA: hypothetical protein VKB76_08880, partial [Ktedonobacterales bacterium]|nr:hypothetical protein [Ktedonobacterales bacterium]
MPKLSRRWLAVVGASFTSLLFMAACGSTGTVTTGPSGATATPKSAAQVQVTQAVNSLSIANSSASDGSVTATCPSGTVLLGGGYSFTGDDNAKQSFMLASYPAGTNTWTVTETNPQAGGAMTLYAYAECLKASFNVTTQIQSATSGSNGTGTASCPGGTILTGGGFKQSHDGS